MAMLHDRQYLDHFCHWDGLLKRHLLCSAFFFAKLKGEIIPNREGGWWEIPGDIPRQMSWRARFIAGGHGFYEDRSGEPYRWHDCPWCGGEMQQPEAPRIAPRDATGDGE